jgi:vacuolar protein sorting-associated protein 13A/C
VNFEASAADLDLIIPSQAQRSEEIHVGLSWTEGLGKYKLTKVITLAPRYLIKNNLPDPLCFRQYCVPPRDRNSSIIEPGQRCPLHFLRIGEEMLLTVGYPGLNTQWCDFTFLNSKYSDSPFTHLPGRSPPINIEDIGFVHFRLKSPGGSQPHHLVRVDCKIEGSTIFVYLSLADEGWPFTIENESDFQVVLRQVVCIRLRLAQTR